MADEVRRMVGLPAKEVEWLEDHYGNGRLSWVLSLLICEFKKAHAIMPDDYAAIAARNLLHKIDDA